MSRDLTKAVDLLRYFFPSFKKRYEELYPDRTIFITHVDRTPEEQLRIFCQGRLPEFPGSIVTWKDGFINKSKHNSFPSEAIDVAVKIGDTVSWDVELTRCFGNIIKDLGYERKIKWGATFKDNYHFEVI